jgi:hypothetical protein
MPYSTKTITMAIGLAIFNATISSTMGEGDDIYTALRSAFVDSIDPGAHIIVYYPTRDDKVRLSYAALKESVVHRVELATERFHGAATSAVGARRVCLDIEQIQSNWGLEDPTQILPSTIAPPGNPLAWARKLTDALRSMSGKHQCSHQTAVWYLEAEVAARQERSDDGVYHLTAGDVVRASKKMVAFMAQEATDIVEDGEANAVFVGGLAEAVEVVEDEEANAVFVGGLAEAVEVVEDEEANAVFVGGLAEAVEEAAQEGEGEGEEEEEGAGAGAGEGAAGWQYQAAGQFQIATHFRK